MILELYADIMAALAEHKGRAPDHRFRHWVRQVESVDLSKATGYAFVGDFVNEGTTEVDDGPAVYLVATVEGSRRYQVTTYDVVIRRGAELETTDIETDNTSKGWALRIRDQVAALLDDIAAEGERGDPSPGDPGLAKYTVRELINELAMRGYVVNVTEA